MKVFVIHSRRTGYGVIRSLTNLPNIKFFIGDTHNTPVFKSKYVEQGFIISDITKVTEDEFLKEMICLAELMDYQTEKPLVYTGKDDYLIFFSKNYAILKDYFRLSFETDFNKLRRALSKFELIDVAKRANVKIPVSFTNEDSIEAILSNSNFPLIVKPALKNKPEIDVVKEAFRVKKCFNQIELESAMKLLTSLNVSYVVQEYVQGGDNELYTIGTYSYEGELKAWSTSKKLRQFPPNTGECSFGVTTYSEDLVDLARRLLGEIGLSGISQIEFKKFKGQYYLIEINPRIWSWHQIHKEVGVNLCLIAAQHVIGNTTSKMIAPNKNSKSTKTWMFLSMDYLYNVRLNKNISIVRFVVELLRCDVEAFLNKKDLRPFFSHIWETRKYIKRQIQLNSRC